MLRLKELRKEIGISQKQFAKDFGVGQNTVSRWETGDRLLDSETLNSVAEYFEVSTDYLLGKTEYRNENDLSDALADAYGPLYSEFQKQGYEGEEILEKIQNFKDAETRDATKPPVNYGEPIQCMLPIIGSIPAGVPILASENIESYYPSIVPDDGGHFYLRVKGDSMINAGIKDGCLVLIKKQNTADNGQIVACRINGDEATLKRFNQSKDTIILLPENSEYQPIIISAKDFDEGYAEIIGVAKSVVCEL